jgi:hypothetical protein
MHTNHININYLNYLTRYIKYLIEEDEEYTAIKNLDETKFKKVYSVIVSHLGIHRDKTIEDIIELRPKTKELVPPEHPVWQTVHQLMHHLKSGFASDDILDSKDITPRSRSLFRMLQVLEEYGKTLQERWKEGTNKNKKWTKKQSWAFSMCPQAKCRPRHIRITNTSLKVLFLVMAKKYPHLKTLHEECLADIETLNEWEANNRFWKALFKVNRVGKRTKGRFANTIETDGVSVCCTFEQRKSDEQCALIDLETSFKTFSKTVKEDGDHVDASIMTEYEEMKTEVKRMKKRLKEKENMIHTTRAASSMMESGSFTIVEDDDGIFRCDRKIVAVDPGMTNAANFVTHDPEAQKHHSMWDVHDGGYHTTPEQRYEDGVIYGNWWRHISGSKRFTKKMTDRIRHTCPEMLNTPTTKTCHVDTLLVSYRHQVSLWSEMERAFFGNDKWFQKTKMRKYVKTQQALETCVTKVTGTKKKSEQKKVIVAFGDGDIYGTMRGVAPCVGSALVRKLKKDTTFFWVNEFRTTKTCSCCHHIMPDIRNQFRIKTCNNKDCIRTHWHRDVNAAINILTCFLYECLHQERHPSFQRTRSAVSPTT